MDPVVPLRRDNNDLTLRLRVGAKPESFTAKLLPHLGLGLTGLQPNLR
jgi:hypothetical protein